MAETLDFDALWPWPLGQFGNARSDSPCLLEVVSFLDTGELDWMPECVGDVLQDFLMAVQDAMPDAERQKLKRFIPRLIGCADEWADDARESYLRRKAITEWLPLALEAAGLWRHRAATAFIRGRPIEGRARASCRSARTDGRLALSGTSCRGCALFVANRKLFGGARGRHEYYGYKRSRRAQDLPLRRSSRRIQAGHDSGHLRCGDRCHRRRAETWQAGRRSRPLDRRRGRRTVPEIAVGHNSHGRCPGGAALIRHQMTTAPAPATSGRPGAHTWLR